MYVFGGGVITRRGCPWARHWVCSLPCLYCVSKLAIWYCFSPLAPTILDITPQGGELLFLPIYNPMMWRLKPQKTNTLTSCILTLNFPGCHCQNVGTSSISTHTELENSCHALDFCFSILQGITQKEPGRGYIYFISPLLSIYSPQELWAQGMETGASKVPYHEESQQHGSRWRTTGCRSTDVMGLVKFWPGLSKRRGQKGRSASLSSGSR